MNSKYVGRTTSEVVGCAYDLEVYINLSIVGMH